MALARSRSRAASARREAKAAVREEKLKNKLAKMRAQAESETIATGVGMHAASVAAGQVSRVMAIRGRPGMGRAINYGAGLGGLLLASQSKKRAGRVFFSSMIGASVGQLFADTTNRDLIPGSWAEGGE